MKSVLALVGVLGLSSAALAQDRKAVPSRDFVVRVDASEPPAFKELWVSRDSGRSWKPAKEAGVAAAWGEWTEGAIRCSLRVPEDGAYDFYAQLGDSLTNRTPEPRPGEGADPKLRCDVREEGRIEWNSPGAATTWVAGQQVSLKWTASAVEFKDRSVRLQYAFEDRDWTTVTDGLETSGSYSWVVPGRDGLKLRLRAVARTRAGKEVVGESAPVAIRGTDRPEIAKARALYDRARVLHAQQRGVEAELKYQEALAAWSEFGEVFNDLGKLHAEQKEPAKALDYFLRARRLCPSDPTPYVNAARMRLELGLREDALADLKDAVELGLEKDERTAVLAGETLFSLARRATEDKDWKRVEEACTLILKIRQSSRSTQAKARQMLEWLKNK
jgi:hypothetical protein